MILHLIASMAFHPRARRCVTWLLLLSAVMHPIYYALQMNFNNNNNNNNPYSSESFLPNNVQSHTKKPSFAACLLIKDDNDLLPEWLAYHYTILPLRHIVVGMDLNSTQDPLPILERWRSTDLHYSILPAEAFVDHYPPSFRVPSSNNHHTENEKQYHHHELVRRQNGFISVCSEYLQRQGVQWTAYIDTDEYVIPNRLSVHDEPLLVDGRNDPNSIQNISFLIRQHLPRIGDMTTTVIDVLSTLQQTGFVGSCYTLPRLLVGALENRTCVDAQQNHDESFLKLSTLRYFQHAVKGDFQINKFGKVFMDLSNIPLKTIESTVPRNIHRPYKHYCGPGSVHFPDTFFYLNHYIGSWERYSSRMDKRRNREEWEKRAYLDDGTPACESTIHEWLPRFIHQVGEQQARYLLEGGSENVTMMGV